MDEFTEQLNKLTLTEESRTQLQNEQTRLIKIVEALTKLDGSKEWNVLKELVFDKSLEAIDRQLHMESLRPEIDEARIYRLQGERAWAMQYSDVNRFVETLKKQLEAIKIKLR